MLLVVSLYTIIRPIITTLFKNNSEHVNTAMLVQILKENIESKPLILMFMSLML